MAAWHFADDTVPQVRRGREPVHEDDRLARPSRSGGVVVESRHTQIHEFAAHGGKMGRGWKCDKREHEQGKPLQPAAVASTNSKIALAFRDEIDILSNRPQQCAAVVVDVIV